MTDRTYHTAHHHDHRPGSAETPAQRWARMVRETPERVRRFNAGLPARENMVAFGRASDRLGYWEYGR